MKKNCPCICSSTNVLLYLFLFKTNINNICTCIFENGIIMLYFPQKSENTNFLHWCVHFKFIVLRTVKNSGKTYAHMQIITLTSKRLNNFILINKKLSTCIYTLAFHAIKRIISEIFFQSFHDSNTFK